MWETCQLPSALDSSKLSGRHGDWPVDGPKSSVQSSALSQLSAPFPLDGLAAAHCGTLHAQAWHIHIRSNAAFTDAFTEMRLLPVLSLWRRVLFLQRIDVRLTKQL